MQPTLARSTNATVSAPRRDNINWFWFRIFGALALSVNTIYAIILVVMAPDIVDRTFLWWLTLCINGALSAAYVVDLVQITIYARAVAPLNGKSFNTQFRLFYKGGYSWEQMSEQLDFARRFGTNNEFALKVRSEARYYPEIVGEVEDRLASGDWRKIPEIIANAERRAAAKERRDAETNARRARKIAELRIRARQLRYDMSQAEQMINDGELSELSDNLSRLAANRDLEARAEKLGIEQQVGAMLREGQFSAAHSLVLKLEANQASILERSKRETQQAAARDRYHDSLRDRIKAVAPTHHQTLLALLASLQKERYETRAYRTAEYPLIQHLKAAEDELARTKKRSKR